jgi:hypothetical protein
MKKALLIGCIVCLLFSVAALAGFVACVAYVAQDPQGMALSVECPVSVTAAEEFTLTVVVRNERGTERVVLGDVDITGDYLDNFLVLGTTPEPRSSSTVPVWGERSFTMNRDIPPGEELRVEFRLRARGPGVHRGEVTAWEGLRFLTAVLETEVR